MKLILCLECHDVVRLLVGRGRRCDCGACSGMYVDKLNAVVDGPCVPIGVSNPDLVRAVKARPQPGGWGVRFEAFVIPPDGGTVVHTNPPTELLERMRAARETAFVRSLLELDALVQEQPWRS